MKRKRRKRSLVRAGGDDGYLSSCLAIERCGYGGADVDGLYEVLGVSPYADFDEIHDAAIARMRETHPDAGGTHEGFCEVQAAASTLLDPLSRRSYDERSATPTVLVPIPEKVSAEPVFSPTFWKESCIIVSAERVKSWMSLVQESLISHRLDREVVLGFRSGADICKEGEVLTIGIEVEPNEAAVMKIVLLMF